MTDITSLRDSSHLAGIMQLAEEVSYHHCMTTIYSSWHSWKEYRHVPPLTTEDTKYVSDADSSGGSSDSEEQHATPYGSCVDIAISTTHALSLALARVPELQVYAPAVTIVARTASTNAQRITHCFTALSLSTCCIVIDPSFDFAPVMLEHGKKEAVRSLGFHHFDGRIHYNYMRYGPFAGHRHRLLWHGEKPTGYVTPFFPIAAHDAVQQISIPMALDTASAPSDSHGCLVPRVKTIKIQCAFESGNQPMSIPYRLVQGRCIATVCRIRIDFSGCKISVLVPYLDWLGKRGNEEVLIAVKKSGIFQGMDEAEGMAMLVLGYDGSDRLWRRKTGLLGEVVEKVSEMGGSQGVGMRKAEFREVVDSVMEFGREGSD